MGTVDNLAFKNNFSWSTREIKRQIFVLSKFLSRAAEKNSIPFGHSSAEQSGTGKSMFQWHYLARLLNSYDVFHDARTANSAGRTNPPEVVIRQVLVNLTWKYSSSKRE